MSTFNQASPKRWTRRESLQLGAATSAAGLLGIEELASPAQAGDLPAGPRTEPFVDWLPVYAAKQPVSELMPVSTPSPDTGSGECGRPPHQRRNDWPANKFYTLKVQEAKHQFHRDLPWQTIWGYDGILPGPTFVERYGVPVIVRISNELPANAMGYGSPEITTHLHNLHCGSESDGFTGDYYSATKFGPTLTAPGGYKDHHYPNCYAGYDKYDPTNGDPREALGTLWYHDHRLDFTAPNVYRGLAGFYLLFDEIDSGDENDPNRFDPNRSPPDLTKRALCLPSGVGKYDIPLLFSDKQFDSSGYLVFDSSPPRASLATNFVSMARSSPNLRWSAASIAFACSTVGPLASMSST